MRAASIVFGALSESAKLSTSVRAANDPGPAIIVISVGSSNNNPGVPLGAKVLTFP